MSDAPSLAELLMQLRAEVAELSRRMTALEARVAIRSGNVGGSLGGDSDPVVVTETEGNTTR